MRIATMILTSSIMGDSMKEYHIYRKTVERIDLTEEDGIECLSDAWKIGKEKMGEPLISPDDYPDDRVVRVRWKVIRGEIDPERE